MWQDFKPGVLLGFIPGFSAKRILDDCIAWNILLGVGLFVLFKIFKRKKNVANCLVDRLENFGCLFKSKLFVLDANSLDYLWL